MIAFFNGAPQGAQKKNEKEQVSEICLVVMPLIKRRQYYESLEMAA